MFGVVTMTHDEALKQMQFDMATHMLETQEHVANIWMAQGVIL
jgi:hypothetical protein